MASWTAFTISFISDPDGHQGRSKINDRIVSRRRTAGPSPQHTFGRRLKISGALNRQLRAHVLFIDTGDPYRFFHRIPAERLAQFLVKDHLDKGGLMV
jgi:hypothetical protein